MKQSLVLMLKNSQATLYSYIVRDFEDKNKVTLWVFTPSGFPGLRFAQPVYALWNRESTWTDLANKPGWNHTATTNLWPTTSEQLEYSSLIRSTPGSLGTQTRIHISR